MAGSYQMVLEGLIENYGDAVEAIEEMLWLIQREIGTDKALKLLHEEYYPMCRKEKEPNAVFKEVERIIDRWLYREEYENEEDEEHND